MLVTLGDPNDLCSAVLGAKAEAMGMVHKHCDEEKFGQCWSVRDKQGRPEDQTLIIDDREYSTNQILFFPRYRSTPAFKLAKQDQVMSNALVRERRSSIHFFLMRTQGVVINPPYSGLANGAKPLQMQQLTKFGFSVPRWLVTNNWADISAFLDTCSRGAIYKSVSGLRSQVRRLTDCERPLFRKRTPPVLVQEYIEGFDVRAHTICEDAIGTQIIGSDQVDYRWSDKKVNYRHIELPGKISKRICKFAKQQNMMLAGFDFRVDSENIWHCLEMNPAPTFATYEIGANQPISEYILRAGMNHIGVRKP